MEPATMFRFVSLLTFCSLASMALMLGYYGEVEVAVGPGCSMLVQASSVFVKGIKVSVAAGAQENNGGLVLYGLAGTPPMDVPAEWSEARRVVVPANLHREWVYFLNKGARIEAAYSVDSETDVPCPVCIVIAQGKGSFIQWTEKISEQKATLSRWLVQGSGKIEQTINHSSEYYFAVHNLNNHQDTTVQLNIRIRTWIQHHRSRVQMLTGPACLHLQSTISRTKCCSPIIRKGLDSNEQRVKLAYEPRWIVYVVGSAILAIVLMLLYEIVSMLCDPCDRGGRGGVERRTPLLTSKEDDSASLGSSYDSVSHDGDDGGGVAERGGEGGCDDGCVVCCDARKDCFFLPCGHSATCYACGARIVEENGSCPLCRRKLKKVRRIFVV